MDASHVDRMGLGDGRATREYTEEIPPFIKLTMRRLLDEDESKITEVSSAERRGL